VVAAASYEARPFGIKAGMPLRQALRVCPNAITIEGNPRKYVDTTIRLLGIFSRFTDLLEAFSVDEAFLDVTHTHHLWGGPRKLALQLKEHIRDTFGLTCSVGIAPNRLLAKLASDMQKPDGLVEIAPEDVWGILEKLPVRKLCGIGEQTEKVLAALGIQTCGDLGKFPEDRLSRLLGRVGRVLHQMGTGQDDTPVHPYFHELPTKSMSHMITLPEDTRAPEIMSRCLLQLAEQVGRRLRLERYRGKTVAVTLRYADFKTYIRQKSIGGFVDSGGEIFSQARSLMTRFPPSAQPVRMLAVAVSQLIKAIEQMNVLAEEDRHAKAQDVVNDRFGEFTLRRASLLIPFPGQKIVAPGTARKL
jgi:DNA polymerase-4